MDLTDRQEKILEMVKLEGPLTGEAIAKKLSVARTTLRLDLAFLTKFGLLNAKTRVGYSYTGKKQPHILLDWLSSIQAGSIQSRVNTIKEDCPVREAIVRMVMDDAGTLFIVDEENYLEGVVSRKDLLRAAISNSLDLPIALYMTRMPNIITVTAKESVLSAARKIIDHQVDALPVVREVGEKKYEVIGRLSKTSIVKLFINAELEA